MRRNSQSPLTLNKSEELLLALLASTVNNDISITASLLPVDDFVWNELINLASRHGVLALVFPILEHLPREVLPSQTLLLSIIGHIEYQRKRYAIQFSVANRFASALKEKGVEMKVLKGISFSTFYETPELRECGDCDCYLSIIKNRGKQKGPGADGFEIGNETALELGGSLEFGSYKHSHLFINKLLFENHHYITDFNGTQQGKKIELILEDSLDKELGKQIGNSELVRPCSHFCALHCLRHAQGNLMLGGMSLRMIYDWAMIMRSEQGKLDWKRLKNDLADMRLLEFARVISSLCEQYFGLNITSTEVLRSESDTVVYDILLDTLRKSEKIRNDESIWQKSLRIFRRFKRMYHFRELATESFPMMIWNTFTFSSYLRRDISLK